jgi:hypothetical protein
MYDGLIATFLGVIASMMVLDMILSLYYGGQESEEDE